MILKDGDSKSDEDDSDGDGMCWLICIQYAWLVLCNVYLLVIVWIRFLGQLHCTHAPLSSRTLTTVILSSMTGEITINLSGGLITPQFSGEIYEDYFSSPAVPAEAEVPTTVSLDNTL